MLNLEHLFEDKEVCESGILSDYDTLDFVTSGEHIYGEIMWPDGDYKESRPCVIMFHGFPGSARNDDISHALCRIGCVVLVPHHRGAWGSEGKYLISRCIEDAKNLANFVRSEDFCKKYNVDPSKIFLVGHSMGGCTVLNAGKQLDWIGGMVMITPFDPTAYLSDGKIQILKDLLRQGKILQSDGSDVILEDVKVHRDLLNFEGGAPLVQNKNLLCLAGEQDSVAPICDMVDPLWNKISKESAGGSLTDSRPIHRLRTYPAEHGLLGRRVATIREIAQFLSDCCNR